MKITKRVRPGFLAAIASLLIGLGVWHIYRYFSTTTVLIVDGKEYQVRTQGKTVAEILTQKNIVLSDKDIVEPAADTVPPARGTITVTRVTELSEKHDEYLPFKVRWKKRMEDNLRPVELQRGIQQRIIKDIRIIYHDGKEVTRQTVRERVITSSVYRLVLLTPDGGIERFYDLSRSKKLRMIATAYYPGDPLAWKDGTVTFLGHKMQRGIVAVDPRVIPLKTRVYVSGYGYGYAGDTGSAIKNRRIDLGVNNADEEKSWMHRPVTVYILEKTDSW